MADAPIRLTLDDDLRRSRLTVFFRLLLAIPHLLWLVLWGVVVHLAAIVNWFATLITGTPPSGLHRFIGAYVRYAIHVGAYLLLAADPYPGFLGRPGSYPVDVEIDPPQRQNRWKVGFRLILLIPALLLAGALVSARFAYYQSGLGPSAAFLGWFAALFTARMPRGLRDAGVYCLRYSAEFDAYMFLLTDRYPSTSPADPPVPAVAEPHPVRISVDDDLRRSRLTTFFRLLLAVPHLVWLELWGVVVVLAAVVNWFATLVRGRSPQALHRFLSAYVRYAAHVTAFVSLTGNPFPGFVGKPGSYPIDLEIAPGERQNRWVTGFRALLAVPALAIGSAVANLLFVAAVLAWFAALFTARMPKGLRDAGAYAIRYTAQAHAYLLLLTDRYPHASPGAEAPAAQAELRPGPAAGAEPVPQPPPQTRPFPP